MCPNAMAQMETAKNEYIEQQQDLINDISYVSVSGHWGLLGNKTAINPPIKAFIDLVSESQRRPKSPLIKSSR